MKVLHRESRPYVRAMRTSPDSPNLAKPAVSAALAPAPGLYCNPVLNEDFPDPALIHAPDGFYYAFGTQTLRDGYWINIQVARSKDLVHWEHLGDALPDRPSWAQETQDF